MFYERYTHEQDNEKIIGEVPGRNRIQDGGFTDKYVNMSLYDDIR